MMPNFTFNTTALNQYEQFIAQNPDFADKLDSMGRFVVMLLISGEREMLSEAGYTVLNMLSLYHEIVLSRHRKINTRLYDDNRFTAFSSATPLIKFVQNVEVIAEMLLCRYGTERGRWNVVLLIEVIKFLVKLYTVLKSKCKVYVDYSVLPTDFQLEFEQRQINEHMDRMKEGMDGEGATHQIESMPNFALDNHDKRRHTVGKRTGHRLPAMTSLPSTRHKQQKAVTMLLSNHAARDTMTMPHYAALIAGEIAHAIRPVIYVVLIMRYSVKSWKPWIISLCIDLLSRSLTNFARRNKPPKDTLPWEENMSALILQDEFRRRMGLWFYYLLRSPLFDKVIAPVIKALFDKVERVPLVSSFVVNIFSYLLALQTYYFYTAAS